MAAAPCAEGDPGKGVQLDEYINIGQVAKYVSRGLAGMPREMRGAHGSLAVHGMWRAGVLVLVWC